MDVDEKSISVENSDKLMRQIKILIGSHNTLHDIKEIFDRNKIAKEYYEKAEDEVISSGNASISAMLTIAISEMAYDIEAYRRWEDELDENKLQEEVRKLKRENKTLKNKMDSIYQLIKHD